MDGAIARGDLLIGLLKVLRDDLPADPDGPKAGLGYTVLAWSRDGETWTRDREPFMDRGPAGAWDHAMTWGDEQLIVGDETFVYYGGYRQGHKTERFTERQIGLARVPRDRYVARCAGSTRGYLRTPPVTLTGARMTVNARIGGYLRVRLLDGAGRPIAGFDWTDCPNLTGDAIAHEVGWSKPLASLTGTPLRLEFALKDAELYGFAFGE
jgi:hypothetical protein